MQVFLQKYKLPILIVLTALLAIFSVRQCQRAESFKNAAESTVNFLNDTVSYYKNENGQLVAEKTALQGGKAALETLFSKQIDSTGQLKRLVNNFRNVDAAGNITQVARIDTIKIGYEIPVPFEFERDWTKSVQNRYAISGTSTQNGITIESLEIPNTLSFVIGKKKTGLFSSEYRIEAVNSNPYVQTTGLDAYSLKVPQKRFSVGLYAGYGLSKDGLSPILGVGLGYSLFSF